MSTTANTKIEVLGKKYPFKFGMKFQRIFMSHYKIDKIDDYQKKIEKVGDLTSLSGQTAFGYFILSAIQAASATPVNVDVDDLIDDVLYKNPENAVKTLEVMSEAFKDSQPTVKEQPSKAVGKSKK